MSKTKMLSTPPAGTFKAIVWKELLENLKWAVLGLLGMTAGLVYKLQPVIEQTRRGEFAGYDRFPDIFEATMFGCALVGLLIGLAQTITENRGDNWGFLAHRPVNRSTLFRAKATSGVLLYTVATGLPLVGALIWIFTPGHLAIPLDWSIALPGLADFLCGVVYYFAGFLTGMRQARWYASRVLGIGAAVVCSALETSVPTFARAAAICAAGLLVVGTAAWSTFIAGGQYRAQTRTGRTAAGISIGLGIVVIGMFATSFALGSSNPPRSPRQIDYVITTDGSIAKTVSENFQIVEVSDLDGKPIERYRNLSDLNRALSVDVLSVELSSRPRWREGYRSTKHIFDRLLPDAEVYAGSAISWYYIHNSNLIAAYENQSGRLIGWMGPDGFSEGPAMPHAFEGPLKSPTLVSHGIRPESFLLFENSVYRLDLHQRRIENIFEPQPGETIWRADSPYVDASTVATYGDTARFEVIATTKRVIVQLRDGTKILEVPHDPKAEVQGELTVYRAMRAPGAPTFLWYNSSQFRNAAGQRMQDQISEFNAAGVLTHHYSVPGGTAAFVQLRTPLILSATIPLGAQAVVYISRWIAGDPGLPRLSVGWWALAIVSSLLSAAATYARGKTYAFARSRLQTWIGIALLLGPLGFLMMLALVEWPALERCPACGKKRVVTLEHCEHCRAPFAAPPMDGTEIFEN